MKKRFFRILFGVTFIAISASGFVFNQQGEIASFSLNQVMADTFYCERANGEVIYACVDSDSTTVEVFQC